MITNLLFTEPHNIELSNKETFKYGDKTISIKDIPFVRYRFSNYTDDSIIEFIRNNKKKFYRPVHLAEVTVDNNTEASIDKINTIENIAIFLYVNITDSDIANGISDEKKQNIANLKNLQYDRLMIRDKSSLLYPMTADKLKYELGQLSGFDYKQIGICGGPLSFRCGDEQGQACLTALWAREIMSAYSDYDDIVVPSANHENMTCCGCIRHIEITEDIVCTDKKYKKTVQKPKKENQNTDKEKSTLETKDTKENKKKSVKKKANTLDWDMDY